MTETDTETARCRRKSEKIMKEKPRDRETTKTEREREREQMGQQKSGARSGIASGRTQQASGLGEHSRPAASKKLLKFRMHAEVYFVKCLFDLQHALSAFCSIQHSLSAFCWDNPALSQCFVVTCISKLKLSVQDTSDTQGFDLWGGK